MAGKQQPCPSMARTHTNSNAEFWLANGRCAQTRTVKTRGMLAAVRPAAAQPSSPWRSRGAFGCAGSLPACVQASAMADRNLLSGLTSLASIDGGLAAPRGQEYDTLAYLCSAQLGLLYQRLAECPGGNHQQLQCSVYVRGQSVAGRGLQLLRVATFPPTGTNSLGMHDASDPGALLLSVGAQEGMGSSSTCNSGQQGGAEECLVSQECIVLPQTGALVYPLTASGQLVGLLVVDSAQSISMGTSSMTASTSSSLGLMGLGSSCSSTATSIQSHQYQQKQNQQQQSQQQQHQQLGGLLPAPHPDAGMLVPPGMSFESGAGSDGSPMGHMLKLDEAEMRCLREWVPAIAASCAMKVQWSAQVEALAEQAASARTLVAQARKPLVALNSFGNMLGERLAEGDVDHDLAQGIRMQGTRLQQLVRELEAALHPASAATGSMTSLSPGNGMAFLQHPQSASGFAYGGVPVLTDGIQTQTQVQEGEVAGTSLGLLRLPPPSAASGSSSVGGSPSNSGTGSGSLAVALSGRDSLPAAGMPSQRLSRSALEAGGEAVMSWRSAHAPHAAAPAQGPHEVETNMTHGERARHMPSSGNISPNPASTTTIDVELGSMCSNSGMDWEAAQAPAAGAGVASAMRPAAPPAAVPAGPAVNLISALQHALYLSWRWAKVVGVEFMVSAPLSLGMAAARSGNSTSSRLTTKPSRTAAMSRSANTARPISRGQADQSSVSQLGKGAGVDREVQQGGANAESARLLPRPPRPLLVAVQLAVLQRLLTYLLDIAMQCTPRGGQLCVSARQEGSGVQVAVLHTGRVDMSRLHTPVTSASSPAAAAVTAAVSVQATRSTARGSGPLISVQMVQELSRQAGGHLTVKQPYQMFNATTGNLDLGTSWEVWLPGPVPAAVQVLPAAATATATAAAAMSVAAAAVEALPVMMRAL